MVIRVTEKNKSGKGKRECCWGRAAVLKRVKSHRATFEQKPKRRTGRSHINICRKSFQTEGTDLAALRQQRGHRSWSREVEWDQPSK